MTILEILEQSWDNFIKYYIGQGLLWSGYAYTLALSAITVLFGTILGSLLAIGKRSKFKPLGVIITAFVEIIRGTPALLQLYLAYFVIPMLLNMPGLSPFTSVAIAMSLNSAAYTSEIIRSGIEAVDKGQTEAARALGLTEKTTMLKIVLPQAIKNILPALGNEFITVVKETSLASTFFVGELMTSYLMVKGNTYLTMECLTITGVLYFALTFILSKGLKAWERSMKAHA